MYMEIYLVGFDCWCNNFPVRCGVYIWITWYQGPVSISDKTSYHDISQNLEGARSGVNIDIAFRFDRHIDSSAADVPVNFQSYRTIFNANLAASRFCEILQ